MADEKIIATEGQPWTLPIDQPGTVTLKTAGKFVDRNIQIEVPEAEYDLTATGKVEETKAPQVSTSINAELERSILKASGVTNVQPESGNYYVIEPTFSVSQTGSSKISVKAVSEVSKEGFLTEENVVDKAGEEITVSSISVEGGETSALYLPVKEMAESLISVVEDNSVNNKDELTIKVTIPAGYYEEQDISKTFSDLLPALENDAVSEDILVGKEAYDENGNKVVGGMADHSEDAPKLSQSGDGTTTIVPTQVTLSDTNTSGLAISAKGQVSVVSVIDGSGYYADGSSSSNDYESALATKYITDIVLNDGNSLNSVTVNPGAEIQTLTNDGSIETLDGTGDIQTLEGDQTVKSLEGDLIIEDATEDGNVVFKETQVVKDGELVKSVATPKDGAIVLTPGWVDEEKTIDVTPGEYETSCVVSAAPAIAYDGTSESVALSTEATDFVISIGGTVTDGKVKATTTVTEAGFIDSGSKSDEKTITVSGANTKKNIYLKAATFDAGLEGQQDGDPAVPETYQVFVDNAGYVSEGAVYSIDVFGGSFFWS